VSGAPAGTLRPPESMLEGYAWLPRMLDKARAELAGVQTGFPFGCPVDHTCMARLGIDPALVRALVARHGGDDTASLAELRSRGIPPPDESWFDAPALEHALQRGGPYLRVRRAEALPDDTAAGGRVFAGRDHGSRVSVVIIDAPPGHRQAPHTHPTEEVLVVHSGSVTCHLGEVQARTVTAGETVRVPAHAVHWLENRGREPLRAVAAYGTATVVTDLLSPAANAPLAR
jgi:quercetin dioxygenase-like cupin family protein